MMWNNCRILLRPVSLHMALGIVISAAASLSSLGLTAAAAWLIVSAAYQPALYQLSLAILGVRVLGVMRAVFRYGERYITHDATFLFLSRLRGFAYRQLAEMPFEYGGKAKGELASLVVRDIETLKEIYLRAVLPLASACLFILSAVGALYFYAPAAAVLLLGSFVTVVFILPFAISFWREKNVAKLVGNAQKTQALYLDILYGAGELIAASRSADRLQEAEVLAQNAMTEKIKDFRLRALTGALTESSGGVLVTAGLFLLIPLVSDQVLSGVHFVVAIFILQSVMEVLLPLPLVWYYGQVGMTAARRVFSLWEEPREDRAQKVTTPFAPMAKEPLLQAERLFFSYAGEMALRDVHFHIDKGERVAIVGHSGAGKSTLFALLLALCRQENGELKLNGTSYHMLPSAAIRCSFGAVMQNTHFFQRTIAENLRILCPGATEDQVWAALERAGLSSFVKRLPEGLQTQIGQHGRQLSGGQRQRLALAAAFLKPTPILLLDEPTQGLDTLTSRQIRREIFSLRGEQAIIYITHELADLRSVDRIIVLQGGMIVETGSFRQLCEKKGIFYQMLHVGGVLAK